MDPLLVTQAAITGAGCMAMVATVGLDAFHDVGTRFAAFVSGRFAEDQCRIHTEGL